MGTIIYNSIREKIRSKFIYVTGIIGIIIVSLLSTTGTFEMNGVRYSSFEELVPVAIIMNSFFTSLIVIMSSVSTIPDEFQKKVSDLVLVRGISELKYVLALTMSNVIVGTLCSFAMYSSIVIVAIYFGQWAVILRIIGAMLVLSVNYISLSAVVSFFSIKTPAFLNAVLGISIFFLGAFHNIITFALGRVAGFGAKVFRSIMMLVPNFSEIHELSGEIITKGKMDMVPVVKQLILVFAILVFIIIIKGIKEIRMQKKVVFVGVLGTMILGLNLYNYAKLYSENNYIYNKALDIEGIVQEEIWEGLRLSDYPVAFRSKNREQVFYEEKVYSRKPVLDLYACTAYPVEGVPNVLIMSREGMDSMVEYAGGMNDKGKFIKGRFGFQEQKMNDKLYISVIYHESLHALQYEEMGIDENLCDFHLGEETLNRIDEDREIRYYYDKEFQALCDGAMYGNIENIEEYIERIKEARKNRYNILKERLTPEEYRNFIAFENNYELREGTARYLEVEVNKILENKNVVASYEKKMKGYSIGREKYYRSGRMICDILDIKNKEWKKELFKKGRNLFELM